MRSRRLILSAGALGTPYLLLANRSAFPNISSRLGTRFTGNGDFLTFAARGATPVDPAVGPVITTAVRGPDVLDDPPGDGPGHYVQDGGYPDFLAWVGQMLVTHRVAWAGKRTLLKLLWGKLSGRPDQNLSAEAAELLGDPRLTAGTLPLLGMGREEPQGRMFLRDGLLDVDWSFERAKPYFRHVRSTMKRIADGLDGEIEDNVLWNLNAVITVHPLGGCPMGVSAAEGVVKPTNGQVHGYPGLHVADGSVMPGTVGPNPSLTIAALANRFADAIIEEGA
jgi:cholesterol oxidase